MDLSFSSRNPPDFRRAALIPGGPYDEIHLEDVIIGYSMDGASAFLQSAIDNLSDGGSLYITVPNALQQLFQAFGAEFPSIYSKVDEFFTHKGISVRCAFTHGMLVNLMEQSSLKIVSSQVNDEEIRIVCQK